MKNIRKTLAKEGTFGYNNIINNERRHSTWHGKDSATAR